MKLKIYTVHLFAFLIFSIGQSHAQCPNDNTQYSSSIAPSSVGSLVTMSSCLYGGEYRLINNLVSGYQYSFETCGDTDFDTQITIYDNVTGASIGYNDDFCGTQSKVTFTSNGNSVRVLIDKYNCSSQSSCMTLNATLVSTGTPTADPCNSIANISCGSSTSFSMASSAGSWSNGPYGTPGEEVLYRFTATNSGNHSVVVTNNNYYVDLFYKTGSCSSTGWIFVDDITTSATNIINLTAGVTYLIMLDDENTTASSGSITINCPAACSAPTNLVATANSTTSAALSWTAAAAAINYNIEYGPSGFSQGSGTTINNVTSPYNLGGLAASTTYEFYVQTNCFGQSSSWAGPSSFTTLCSTLAAPLSEDFGNGSLPTCWTQTTTSGSGWEFPGTPGWGVHNVLDNTTGSGNNFACIDFSSTDVGTIIQMPDVDISALSDPYLEFYMYSNNTNSSTLNDLFIEYWDGAIWGQLAYLSEDNGGWTVYRYDLATFGYNSNTVRLRFRAESSGATDDYFNDILLDDISIINDPCLALRNNSPETTSAYLCQGESGTITVNSLNGGTLNWYDAATGGNLVQTGNSLSSTPSSTTNYWVEEADNNACKSLRQAISFEISPYQNAPQTSDNSSCAGSVTTLNASGSSGALLNWYDAASGGNMVHTGTSYDCTLNSNQTYWVEQFGGQQVAMSTANSVFASSLSRGYWFTAPCDFVLSGVRVPTDASTDNQSVEIVRFSSGNSPQNYPTTSNSFTSLLRVANEPGDNIIPCQISVTKGDVIGVLGGRGSNAATSYGTTSFASNIYGNPITLQRLGMQSNLINSNAQALFTENSGSIGRVELYYGNCNSNRTAVNASISEPSYAAAGSTSTSDASCVVNENGVDWTYYYSSTNPEDLLFAIAHDPNNLGNNNFTATVDIHVQNDASNPNNFNTGIYKAEDPSNQEANFVMGRHWNVTTSGTLVDPVKVRFYYQDSELAAINSAATAWMNTYNYAPNEIGLSDALWFKTNGTVYDPAVVVSPSNLYGIIDKTDDAQDGLTANNGTNYVEIENISNFSGGSVAINVSRAAFLDVSLTSFSVKKHEQTKALVGWSTEREENMLGFHIERSSDGIEFERIGIVYPTGGLNQSVAYSFIDASPLMGNNYYRLAMEELSGHIDYTITQVVSFAGDYGNLRVLPNPFDANIEVKFDALIEEDVNIIIYNSIGKVVYRLHQILTAGNHNLNLDLGERLASGAYWLQFEHGTNIIHKKIIKK